MIIGHSDGQSDPTRTERASSKSKKQLVEAAPSLSRPAAGNESASSTKETKRDLNGQHVLSFPLYIESPFLPVKKEPIKLDISVKVVPKPRPKSEKKERKRSKQSHKEDPPADTPMDIAIE